MQDFTKLKVWEKAHKLALDIYHISNKLPPEEKYGLKVQIRRSSLSIPTNIAEGCGRNSSKDTAHFCQMSYGSATELEYQCLLLHDLGMINPEVFESTQARVVEVKKMLSSLIKVMRQAD